MFLKNFTYWIDNVFFSFPVSKIISSKSKKRFLRGRYTGETYKIGNEVNITMTNIDEFSGDIEFNLNYKRKNLASRGKVLTHKPNKK